MQQNWRMYIEGSSVYISELSVISHLSPVVQPTPESRLDSTYGEPEARSYFGIWKCLSMF